MATFNSIADLCRNNDDLSDPELISRLKVAAEIDPDIIAERNEYGWTLLHIAAEYGRSPNFCKVLHELDATLVGTQDNGGWLPMHNGCSCDNVDTAKYSIEIYPQSIDIANDIGMYPLHILVQSGRIVENNESEAVELFQLLLKQDRGAVSAPDDCGDLPLHYACNYGYLMFVKPLFDLYPDAIFIQNNHGDTSLDLAISYNEDEDVVQYLETQLRFRNKALDDQGLDNNGRRPIHQALQDRVASVGAIKLMITAHPASVTVADKHGCIPLHLACRYGHLDIVKHLVDQDKNSLITPDSGGNLPLHYACLGGKPDIVNCILDQSAVGVTFQNTEGKLPIELLLFYNAECDRSSMEFVDTVESLLKANPVIALANLCPGLFACGE